MCAVNLSTWCIPSQRGDRCRCGREFTPDEVEAPRRTRLEFEASELRARYRLGLVAA